MNERIRELALQAGFYANPDVEKFEKFAEFIIQECMSQIALIGISNSENEDISWACHKAVKNIKDQFGIE